MQHKVYQTTLGGRPLSFEFGRYAEQAGCGVLVRHGDTVLLVTATAAEKARAGIDFFPLSVDYEEKLYAAGKIPGSWQRRESRPGEKAILTSRLIDRPIRPLFPHGMRHDVQIVATCLSIEQDNQPDIPAMIGSSIALSVSEIPFAGPTGAAEIGLVDGEFVISPTQEQREKSKMHLVVSGTKDAVMMVEAGAEEVPEDQMLAGILFAHEEIKKQVAFQEMIVAEIGAPKREFPMEAVGDDVRAAVTSFAAGKVVWSVDTFDRSERQGREDQVKAEVLAHFSEQFLGREREIADCLYEMTKAEVRRKIVEDGVRPDGRNTRQVRPIWCEAGILPRVHGSAVFTRGQTQALTIATLGGSGDQQEIDGIGTETSKRYLHHYNMPPYSTGEAKMMRGAGRREIGHGALAERALLPVIPSEADFPYTIRLVSEILSSNGSTSQASVCGSTLALMDAGVPIKAPVAGAAMGLIKDEKSGKVVVLTDIQGLEDFFGDMDFKVAGTKEGITAIQMDIKIKGIDEPILKQALAQAFEARMHIMGEMMKCLSEPRAELSKHAPKIVTFTINPEKIGEVVGPRGKMINKIIAETGVKIDIEDDGRVFILTQDAEAAKTARARIEGIAKDIVVGEVYTGKVVRIMPFGAFVELLPGKDGMAHISQLSNQRVERVEDVVNIGDTITVKVIEIDEKGRVNVTRKGFIPEGEVPRVSPPGSGPAPAPRPFTPRNDGPRPALPPRKDDNRPFRGNRDERT